MSLTLRIPGDRCREEYPGAICACRWPSITTGMFRCMHPEIAGCLEHDNLMDDDARPGWCPFGANEIIVTFSTRKVEGSDV